MSENEDPEVLAMREKADRVMARRAAARAEALKSGGGGEEDNKPAKATGRRWYHWVIDFALLSMAAYFIKVRFFTKEPEPVAAKPSASTSAPSGSSNMGALPSSSNAAASVVTQASAEVRLGPGLHFAAAETLAASTRLEVLEPPATGWVKVKTPSGKTGWLPAEAIAPQK